MIELLRTDITTLRVDAIVNAANSGMRGGGGVDGAIHKAAGPGLLQELVRRNARCVTGDAVLTAGYDLPAKWIIHAVGPVWRGGFHNEPALLRHAYERAFARAREVDVRSIAFPAISTGAYGYPREDAAGIALQVMFEHEPQFQRIIVAAYDGETEGIYQRLLAKLRRAHPAPEGEDAGA